MYQEIWSLIPVYLVSIFNIYKNLNKLYNFLNLSLHLPRHEVVNLVILKSNALGRSDKLHCKVFHRHDTPVCELNQNLIVIIYLSSNTIQLMLALL